VHGEGRDTISCRFFWYLLIIKVGGSLGSWTLKKKEGQNFNDFFQISRLFTNGGGGMALSLPLQVANKLTVLKLDGLPILILGENHESVKRNQTRRKCFRMVI
jgi:hypothetical protein